MKGSLFFIVILGLGVAVPYAKSGKPVGTAFWLSLVLLLIGAAVLALGLAQLSAEQRLNGAVNLPVILGVLP